MKALRRKRAKSKKRHSKVSSLKAEILIYFIKMGLKCSVKIHAQRNAVILKRKIKNIKIILYLEIFEVKFLKKILFQYVGKNK